LKRGEAKRGRERGGGSEGREGGREGGRENREMHPYIRGYQLGALVRCSLTLNDLCAASATTSLHFSS
jgi:hypothetical protein